MSKIRANFISSKNDNKAVEFTSGIVVGGAVTATNFDFNAEVYNVGTGASIGNPANNELALGTNNTEKVRITSAGEVRVNNAAGASVGLNLYQISGAAAQVRFQGSATGTGEGDGFGLGNSGTVDAYVWNYEAGHIQFATSNSPRLTITSGGELQIANGNLKLSTAGTGIDFSATEGSGASSSLLDDYEEGTHTTVFADSGTGTITVSSGNDQLSYIKIGNLVNVIGRPLVGSVSSPTGYFSMTLPFTTADVADAGCRSAAALNIRLVNTGYDVGLFTAQVSENSNLLSFGYGGSTDTTVSGPAMKAGTQIWINITYRVA